MGRNIIILTIFLTFFYFPLFAQDALILGGINRIKKNSINTDNFVLIESDKIEIENGDVIKTKAKGYILIQKEGYQILIFPFTEIEISNISQNSFHLISGKIWVENNKNIPNVVTAGSYQYKNINGVSSIEYFFNKEKPESEEISVVSITGQSTLSSPTQNFLVSDYKKVSIKNKKTTSSMIPIDEMISYINAYKSYQGLITGWNNRQIDRERLLFKPAGGVSLLNAEENSYIVLSLKPQFKYKDVQFGFIFPFYVNIDDKKGYKPRNWGNYSEWNFEDFNDSLSDFILKIDYFTYGEKYKSPFYFNAGNINRMSLKNHLIINEFKPNLNYPQTRQLNLETGFQTKYFTADAIIANCASAEIFGLRASYKPLVDHYLFKKFEIGITTVTDADPDNQYNSHGKYLAEFAGLDLNVPIYNFSEIMTFNFTSEFAKAAYYANNKTYNVPGFGYSYGLNGTIGDILVYQFGGLILKDNYQDSYFDALYISQRQEKFQKLMTNSIGNHYGIFGDLTLDLENIFKIEMSYREVLDNDIIDQRPNNKFSFYFYLYPSIMDFAYIVISVDRFGIRNFSNYWNEFFTSDLTAITASLRLPFKLKYLELQLNYRRSLFIDNNVSRTENTYESQIKFVF